ncbi:MAG: hypothetical protein HXY46_16150 [Syntrophaceae bacterium]|nr:hypothetical protein [Syntrophaceae bacterium]
MKLLDEDLFVEGDDDAEAPRELNEGDKDFLKNLEKQVAEIENEPENPG